MDAKHVFERRIKVKYKITISKYNGKVTKFQVQRFKQIKHV